jgi:hypothetical protein
MTFSQKYNLVRNIPFLKETKFARGIEILNSLRNKLSHDMTAKIDNKKVDELKSITLEYVSRDKSGNDLNQLKIHFELFDVHAAIERFTSIVCARIAGYCSSLVGVEINSESYYKAFRSDG